MTLSGTFACQPPQTGTAPLPPQLTSAPQPACWSASAPVPHQGALPPFPYLPVPLSHLCTAASMLGGISPSNLSPAPTLLHFQTPTYLCAVAPQNALLSCLPATPHLCTAASMLVGISPSSLSPAPTSLSAYLTCGLPPTGWAASPPHTSPLHRSQHAGGHLAQQPGLPHFQERLKVKGSPYGQPHVG